MASTGGFVSTLLAGRSGRLRLFALFAAAILPILVFAVGAAYVVYLGVQAIVLAYQSGLHVEGRSGDEEHDR